MRLPLLLLPAAGVVALAACSSRLNSGGSRPFVARDTLAALATSVDAATVELVELRAGDGAVRVTAGAGDSVRVWLVLAPHRDPERRDRCTRKRTTRARLVAERHGTSASLRAEPSLRGKCGEAWRVEVPAGVALHVRGQVADIIVSGVAGGVNLSTGVGDIVAQLPRGSVQATVRDVGDVTVETASTDYGDATLRASVGTVVLSIGGHRVATPHEPGAGEHIALRGPGRDTFTIRTGVGKAQLAIEARRPQSGAGTR